MSGDFRGRELGEGGYVRKRRVRKKDDNGCQRERIERSRKIYFFLFFLSTRLIL